LSGVFGALLARNALLNLASLGLPLVFAFIAIPFIIAGLGAEQFGVLAILWMLLSYLSDLGFGTASTRYAAAALGAGRTDELSGIASSTARLQIAVGVIEGAVLAALTPWITTTLLSTAPELVSETRACFYLLAAAIPLLGLARSFRGLAEAAQRFDLALAVHLPITIGTYVLAAAGAMRGWSLLGVFAVIVALKLVSVPAYVAIAHRALPGLLFKRTQHRVSMRELVAFAGWMSVSALVTPLLLGVDRFMLGALLSIAAVTFYAAPYEIVTRLVLVPAGIVGALYPAFSHLSGQRDSEQAERLAARAANMILVILGPIIILTIAGAHEGLRLWLGEEYAQRGATAVQILAVGVLINAAAHVPYGLLQSAGRPDVPARLNIIEVPIHILVSWLLIQRFGIAGAALAWTIRVALDAVFLFTATSYLQVLGWRALQKANLLLTLAILAVAAGLAGFASTLAVSLIAKGSISIALALACALLLWSLSVAATERRQIRTFLRLGS
jgi:O-antigen/teichoic acid export membrane protein